MSTVKYLINFIATGRELHEKLRVPYSYPNIAIGSHKARRPPAHPALQRYEANLAARTPVGFARTIEEGVAEKAAGLQGPPRALAGQPAVTTPEICFLCWAISTLRALMAPIIPLQFPY